MALEKVQVLLKLVAVGQKDIDVSLSLEPKSEGEGGPDFEGDRLWLSSRRGRIISEEHTRPLSIAVREGSADLAKGCDLPWVPGPTCEFVYGFLRKVVDVGNERPAGGGELDLDPVVLEHLGGPVSSLFVDLLDLALGFPYRVAEHVDLDLSAFVGLEDPAGVQHIPDDRVLLVLDREQGNEIIVDGLGSPFGDFLAGGRVDKVPALNLVLSLAPDVLVILLDQFLELRDLLELALEQIGGGNELALAVHDLIALEQKVAKEGDPGYPGDGCGE